MKTFDDDLAKLIIFKKVVFIVSRQTRHDLDNDLKILYWYEIYYRNHILT